MTGPSVDPQPLVLRDMVADGVLLLTWNRPDRANAWTLDLERAYFAALDEAALDPAVRAIVVTGAGRHFCPGMDRSIIDDVAGHTLVAASDAEASLRSDGATTKSDRAKRVGQELAARAKEKGITAVVFDRGGFLYHGRVKALADGAREGGLDF